MTGKTPRQMATEAAVNDDKDKQPVVGDTITLANGAVLKLRRVAPLAIREASARVPEPQVPIVFIKEKERDEPNPEDPDYLKAAAKYDEATSLAVVNVILLMGTKLESVPVGVSKPEDDDWIEDLEYLGITFDVTDRRTRYLSWLQYYALTTNDDIVFATSGPMMLSGISEGEVDKAVDSFRRLLQQRINPTQQAK